ncbi:ROK family protein [Candidatus Kapabacteria bacterium]|nr:ROK family protein [Candidatus Kapabacteria bacterium]
MYLGIDIGGTNIKWGIFDLTFNLLEKHSKPTNSDYGPSHIIDSISEIINKNTNCRIGIGFPSVVSDIGYVHISPNMKDFENINLKDELSKRTSKDVIIENDANVAALAELHFGNGIGLDNFIYVTLGTGIGGAIIINRKIFKGDNFGAGEIGYTTINFDDTRDNIKLNRKGILEDYTGLPRLTQKYQELGGDISMSMKEISLNTKSDKIAIELFEYYGEMLGYGIASAMNLLDINNVIIGGGLSQVTDIMYNRLNEILKIRLLEHKQNNFVVQKAKYLSDAGIYGAASLYK